jgi:signal transduction histidine kinase
MGRRLRTVLALLALLATTALAVPLALSSADRRTSELAEERGRQVAAIAQQVALPGADPAPVVRRYHELYGEGALVVAADGRPLAQAGLDPGAAGVSDAVAGALVDEPPDRWQRVLPWRTGPVLVRSGVRRDGELVAAVVLRVDRSEAAYDVARAWGWLALACLVVLGTAVLVAHALTTWLLRPLSGLERAVAEMTAGTAGAPAPVTGPPELRHLATGFNTMVEAVRESLDRQRRLVADASHQLRNPLAAVRLRADLLETHVADTGREPHRALTAELDRLESLLQQMLLLARAEETTGQRQAGLVGLVGPGEGTELADMVAERIAAWRTIAAARGASLVARVDAGLRVALEPQETAQLLDIALDNAIKYGGRTVTVTAEAGDDEAGDDEVDLVVADDGPGIPEADRHRASDRFWRGDSAQAGSGLGLAIAREIVSGHGGRITLETSPTGGLLVRHALPREPS